MALSEMLQVGSVEMTNVLQAGVSVKVQLRHVNQERIYIECVLYYGCAQ